MDINTLISKGGPVMWVLLGYSVAALGITVERLVFFLSLSSGREAAEGWRRAPEAVVARCVREAAASGVRDLDRVAARAESGELARLRWGLPTLAWLGHTAPLWGLLGTIMGMIKAFMVIEAAGGGVDARALAGGIWEAMVTTGAGLTVSIPVLFAAHVFEGWVARRLRAMRETASLTIEALSRGRSEPHAAGDVEGSGGVAHAS